MTELLSISRNKSTSAAQNDSRAHFLAESIDVHILDYIIYYIITYIRRNPAAAKQPTRRNDGQFMQITIMISDADRDVDYILAVACDFLSGSAPRSGWLDGGEPGEAPAVEISCVRCLEMVLWCGKSAVSAQPAADPRESIELRIGKWCLEKFPDEIEAAVLAAILARRDAGADND